LFDFIEVIYKENIEFEEQIMLILFKKI